MGGQSDGVRGCAVCAVCCVYCVGFLRFVRGKVVVVELTEVLWRAVGILAQSGSP